MSETPTTVITKGDDRSSKPKESENWIVILSKDQLFVHAEREREVGEGLSTTAKNGWCLQSTAVQVLARLPDSNDMDFVCVYAPVDADTVKIAHLLQQLVKVGKRKSFTVASMNLPHTVKECLSAFGVEASTSNKLAAAQFTPVLVQ